MLFRVYVHVVVKDFSALSSGGSNSVFLPVPVVPYVTSALCTLLVTLHYITVFPLQTLGGESKSF